MSEYVVYVDVFVEVFDGSYSAGCGGADEYYVGGRGVI